LGRQSDEMTICFPCSWNALNVWKNCLPGVVFDVALLNFHYPASDSFDCHSDRSEPTSFLSRSLLRTRPLT
jgi:hypothetical protein